MFVRQTAILCALGILSLLGGSESKWHTALLGKYETKSWRTALSQLRQDAWKINFHELSRNRRLNEVTLSSLFKRFVLLFERPYIDDESEYVKRQAIFKNGLIRQASLNVEEEKYKTKAVFGINKFSDWSEGEFRGLLRSHQMRKTVDAVPNSQMFQAIQEESAKENGDCTYKSVTPPETADWRKERKTTEIKNQGNCGSCWAFVATEQTETFSAITDKALEDLSVQEFISCAPSLGCNGGNTCEVLAWLASATYNGSRYHLVSASEYPYEAKETACKYQKTSMKGATISGVCGCTSMVNNELAMVQVVAQKGPLAVNVNSVLWHDYVGGIIQRHCTNKTINHAVQLVGYDLSGPVPYWIARNSWGPDFGEDGYLRIKYGGNLCGLAEEPSFILI